MLLLLLAGSGLLLYQHDKQTKAAAAALGAAAQTQVAATGATGTKDTLTFLNVIPPPAPPKMVANTQLGALPVPPAERTDAQKQAEAQAASKAKSNAAYFGLASHELKVPNGY